MRFDVDGQTIILIAWGIVICVGVVSGIIGILAEIVDHHRSKGSKR